ncbi:MAG: AMP-binding protein [Dehalococcoidia bacterium]|nr:MAG: AMP-binding protein [Dehalococcoidia bacterium]
MPEKYFDKTLETMPLGQRRKYELRELRRMLRHAYAHCEGVRKQLNRAGIKPEQVKTLGDLEKIPVLGKDELRGLQEQSPPFGGYLGAPPKSLRSVFCSPGPMFEPHESSDAYYTRHARVFYNAGLRKGDILLSTFSYHMVPAGLLVHESANRVGATAIPTGPGNTELQIDIMRTLGVTAYIGTPSFLAALIARAEEKGYVFQRDFRLRKALCSVEVLTPSMRSNLESYGLNVTQCYACADIGNFAYECSRKNGFHICEEVFVEIVDPVTKSKLGAGEVGEVVVTPLDARVYPLVRFGIGDLSQYTDETCACGRTSIRIQGFLGRVGEAVKVRGMFLHPRQVGDFLSSFAEVSCWSAIVTRARQRDELELRLELNAGTSSPEQLTDRISSKFAETCRVKVDKVECLTEGAIPDEEAAKVIDRREWK